MNQVLDVLLLRRVRLEYISPPICQAILSGSGSSLMLAAVLGPEAPHSLTFSGQCERFLTWVGSDETVCTSLYKAQNPLDPLTLYVLEAECLTPGSVSVCSDGWWCYSTLTADGVESDRSEPVLSPLVGARVNIPVTIPDGAVRLNLFRNPDPNDVNGTYALVLSTTALGGAFEVCDLTGCYKLQTISNDGASDLSAPICHSTFAGCIPYVLTDILGPNERCCIGVPFSTTLEAIGGFGPFLWEVALGSLPPGLTLQPGPFSGPTTTIDGTPTTGGDYNFSIRCTDVSGHELVKPFSLSVLGIVESGSGLPDATTDTDYTYSLTASGGTAPYQFSLVGGSLPTGFSLSSSGVISGTGFNPETSSFTVRIVDSSGFQCDATLQLEVVGCPNPLVTPTFAVTTQTAMVYGAFDPARRIWWKPQTAFGGPPYQTVYRIDTRYRPLVPLPDWTANATDTLGKINTAAKGDTGSGMGRCLVSRKYNEFLVFGNQSWVPSYDLDSANCTAINQIVGAVPQMQQNDAQQTYDDVRGYSYMPLHTGLNGKISVFDCNPSVLQSIAVYDMLPTGYHGGPVAYVPDTDTLYLTNSLGSNVMHRWDPVTHAFTFNIGPAGFASDVWYAAHSKVLIVKTSNTLFLIDPINDPDGASPLASIGLGGGGLNFCAENSCTGHVYISLASANSGITKIQLTAPYTKTTTVLNGTYESLAFDPSNGLLFAHLATPTVIETRE